MSSVETRAVERDSMFLMTDIVPEVGGPPVTVYVRNLSASGMMIQGDIPAEQGTRIATDLRNIGPIAGTVVWMAGKRAGVAFDEQIDPSRVRVKVYGGEKEAPVYARAALAAPRHDGWNGKLRRV